MDDKTHWLRNLGADGNVMLAEGLVSVKDYDKNGRPADEVVIMERASHYGAHAVFFEAQRNGARCQAQAFIYVADNEPAASQTFAELHQRLWSWGGVPLVYRKVQGLVQLFRCGHKPDFADRKSASPVCKPFKTLNVLTSINDDPWWNADYLRNGTLWDKPEVCNELLSARNAAHKSLIRAFKRLNNDLNDEGVLPKRLRRKLLILSLLIAYLEERKVLLPSDFQRFVDGAKGFSDIMVDGSATVQFLAFLEERFNGHVFVLSDEDRATLRTSNRLIHFVRLLRSNEEQDGQLALWRLYSFKDLPVELISEVYQIFVKDADSSVYTPPFLVRLMLDEVLTFERLDQLDRDQQLILDPSCGSGVFLVEAYKRIVLHWRSRNEWKKPTVSVLKKLLQRLCGVDLEEGAIELAAFSLCLALCDALEPEDIRSTVKLFPPLAKNNLHASCFFKAVKDGVIKQPVGVVIGNPPFTSNLNTIDATVAYEAYEAEHGTLPDKQLAYLFQHESLKLLSPGGVSCLLQCYNILYNQQSLAFRRQLVSKWNLREVLDFVSVRGLFQKGGADTKVLVVIVEALPPDEARPILHATFRRTGRIDAEQGFDIDYYDLHWLPRKLVLEHDAVWRCNLHGGGRLLGYVERLKQFETLAQLSQKHGWDCGEGFIEGQSGNLKPAGHLTGKPYLASESIGPNGIDVKSATIVGEKRFKTSYTAKRFTAPMILIREQMDLGHGLIKRGYYTYRNKVVGICSQQEGLDELERVNTWITRHKHALQAYVSLISLRMYTQKATTLSEWDVLSLPYSRSSLQLSQNEQILVEDVVLYYRDLIRLGEDSEAMALPATDALPSYTHVFCEQINGIYKNLRALPAYSWTGIICQPFAFGEGVVDWDESGGLKERVNRLLHEQQNRSLNVTRIARIYDENFIFFLKPDRLRFWLKSVALRDADEALYDLRNQGF